MEKIDWNKVLYTAVVLNQSSQDALKLYLDNMIGDKVADKILCHHMTVAFGKNLTDAMKNYIEMEYGHEFTLTPVAYGESDKSIAIKVETNAISLNNIKHITLCTMNGGKPMHSNLITNWKKINKSERLQLKGTLTCVTKNK